MQRKTLKEREADAVWHGKCLVHPRLGNVRMIYELRHGKVPSDHEVNCSCHTKGCILDKHHFLRPRKKTAEQYEKESTKIGQCLIHPSRGAARHVYQLRHGKLPSSKICVCHKCDVKKCIRDSHHFLGTQQDNIQDMKRKGRQRTPEWTSEMRTKKSETSKRMWSDLKWAATQRKKIRAAHAKRIWTQENSDVRSEAAKRGHVTRRNNGNYGQRRKKEL